MITLEEESDGISWSISLPYLSLHRPRFDFNRSSFSGIEYHESSNFILLEVKYTDIIRHTILLHGSKRERMINSFERGSITTADTCYFKFNSRSYDRRNNDEHFRLEKSTRARASSKGIRFRASNHPAYLLADFLESRTLDTHGLGTFPRLCSFIAAGDYGTGNVNARGPQTNQRRD